MYLPRLRKLSEMLAFDLAVVLAMVLAVVPAVVPAVVLTTLVELTLARLTRTGDSSTLVGAPSTVPLKEIAKW